MASHDRNRDEATAEEDIENNGDEGKEANSTEAAGEDHGENRI